MDGTSSLYIYEKMNPSSVSTPSYVSQEEFKNTVNILLGEIEKLKGDKKDDKPQPQQQPITTVF